MLALLTTSKQPQPQRPGLFRLAHPERPQERETPELPSDQETSEASAAALLASTNEGDLVFDPFSGSGTTAAVAKELNQAFVGAELQEEFAELAIRRIGVAERGGVSRRISERLWTGA